MCTVCGCGDGEVKIEGHEHAHTHADGTTHSHPHDHEHEHAHGHAHEHDHHHHHAHAEPLDFGAGPARAHVPGMSQTRMVQIEQDILAKNNAYAAANRRYFDERGIFALNLVSSPGSGKTTLLVRTIELLKARVAINVVEGDQQTINDAERIRATGVPALQINTGKGCHLDGHMVGHAMERLQPADESLFQLLRKWRADTAREQGVPAYVILHDKTLRELAETRPVSHGLLAGITGMGSAKIEHYGDELLQLIRNEG